MSRGSIHTSELKVVGENLISKVKELVRQGNIRRLIIKNEKGQTLIEVPLTIGVVGAVVAPVWAALGAIAALAANVTIVVEKVEELPETGEWTELPRMDDDKE